jgi:hypothetical protein
MKYLVCTSCGIYLVNKDKPKRVYKHHCYGLSWSKDYIFACQRSGSRTKTDSVVVLTKNFKVKAIYPSVIQGVHQAYYDHETELLYIVNTCHGRIERMRPDGSFAKSATWDFARKWNNNSIWKHKGNFWVVEHNYQRPSNIKCVNEDFTKVVDNVHIGTQLHNVAIVDNFMYFCHSPKALLRCYNMTTRKGAKAKELIYRRDCKYTRGLAIGSDRILVGSSTHCPRMSRGMGTKSIFITELDYKMRVEKSTPIKQVNQCNEIRMVGEPDLAHNGIVLEL